MHRSYPFRHLGRSVGRTGTAFRDDVGSCCNYFSQDVRVNCGHDADFMERILAMTRLLLRALFGFVTILCSAAAPADARDQLIIGMTQFPSTLHPSIDSMLAKSYVLGFTQRPFTTYDQNWELVCLLCTDLPTIENGKAKQEDLSSGFRRDAGTT